MALDDNQDLDSSVDQDPDEDPNDDPPDDAPEETDDGGAIVKIAPDEDDDTADQKEFYANLVDDLPEADLSRLATDLLEYIDHDRLSRKSRDEKYAEGIKRTGLGDEAPGGAAFDGASTAVHPMMSKATVYYQSHTIGELFPPGGPVRDDIVGTATPQRVEKAQRKVAHMNWQFKRQMPEFRSQLEKLLSQQPLAGSQYMRLVYDDTKKRPVPMFFPIDDVYIPDAASDFYSAERRTVAIPITQAAFESRVRSGYYIKPLSLSPPSQLDEESEAQKATDKVQGVDRSSMNEDGLRMIYVVECLADIEDTEDLKIAGDRPRDKSEGELEEDAERPGPLPYLIEVDKYSRQIMRITRNWEEDDELHENMCWISDFEFIPWSGSQSVGLIHLAGSLAGAGTGSLRALLDSALVNNLATGIKLKGSGTAGSSNTLNIGQLTELEGGVGVDDIRKLVMPLPFNEPSTMLFQLLGWCTDEGEQIVRTTFENLSEDGSPNMPVGTTLALIEQGLKVLSAIHMRLHHAMDRVIGILHRINRMYITDNEILDDTGEHLAFRSDYEGPVDVVPVSDPQVFSDVQRFAQLQIVQQRADLHPELYDAMKVEEMILERTKIPNATDLLKKPPEIHELNQVNENVAMTLGRPVAAFPEQDHLAHIQVLLDFAQSPVLGQLPIIAPSFLPPAMAHLKEHIVYWYVTHMHQVTSEATGADTGKISKIKDQDVSVEMDKLLATASPQVIQAAAQAFQKIPQIVAAALQMIKQSQPQPQGDPTATAVANIGAQAQQAKIASDDKNKEADRQADLAKQTADQHSQMMETQIQEQGDDQREAAEIQSKEKINAEDNSTALEISAAKIETGHGTNLSTGTGINPSP